jgi:pyruvate dehydrogenase E2 component (dihydrolipoamide acetyltransferase)
MAYEFKFPDVGEGITEGELLSWKVKEGDVVAEDQTLAEVETDKAVVEIPSPKAGRIVKLHVEEGEIIEVGHVLVTIEEGAGAAAPMIAAAAPSAVAPTSVAAAAAPAVPAPAAPPVPASSLPAKEAFYTGSVVGQLEEAPDEDEVAAPRTAPAAEALVGAGSASGEAKALAMPSIRALAKELGVDINRVRGTGPSGRVLRQDVEDWAEAGVYGRETVSAPAIAKDDVATGESWMGGTLEHDEHGVVERVPFRGIRRTMARRMADSLAHQAQVTTTEEADVTILRRIREKERTLAAERGIHLTYLAFVIKACTAALKRFPRVNATIEPDCGQFSLKRYYHIGMAVDTKAGLVVPNIKDCDQKSIFRIAEDIMDLVNRAQERRLDLVELKGGTFTVTNYGAIGGLYATPVTNYPEVAILGMGRVREMPVVQRGQVAIRLMLPLSLTYDHQLIDGAEATRFLNLVISYLEDPDLLLLEGA